MSRISKFTPGFISALVLTLSTAAQAQLEEIVVTAQKRSESLQDVPIAMQAVTGDQLERYNADSAEDILNLFPNLNTNVSNEVNKGFTIRGVGTNNFHGNVNRAVGTYQDEVSLSTPYTGVLGLYDIERVEVLRGPQNTLFGRNTTGGAINYISKLPQPGEDTNGFVKTTYGKYNQIDIDAAVGFSLSDTLAFRISAQRVTRDGLFTNLAPGRVGEELGKKKRLSARLQALWEPTGSTSLLFNIHFGDNSGTMVGNKASGLVADGTVDPSIAPPRDATAAISPSDLCAFDDVVAVRSHNGAANDCTNHFGFNPTLQPNGEPTEWKHVYNVTSAVQDVEVLGGFIKAIHEFGGGIELTSITAIENTEILVSDDNGAANSLVFVPTQDATYKQFSQEIRIASSQDGSFRWIGGLYFFSEDMLLGTNVINDDAANGNGALASNILDQEDRDISVYGQMEYDFSERATMTFGLRYTNNEKTGDSTFRITHLGGPPSLGMLENNFADLAADPSRLITNEYVLANVLSAPPVTNVLCNAGPNPATLVNFVTGEEEMVPARSRICQFPDLKLTLNEIGLRAGVDFKVTDNSLLYASYSRGFKAGGFDTRALVATTTDANPRIPVKPETLDAIELGYKATLADGKFQFNTALFYYIWKDLQTFATVNAIPGFYNVPESKLFGLEAEIKWSPKDTWLISGGIGYLDTEVTDVGDLAAVLDKGHELPNSPKLSFNAAILKDFPIANGSVFTLQGDIRYVGTQIDNGFLFNINPNPAPGTDGVRPVTASIDGVNTKDSQFYLNFRLAYLTANEKFEVSIWGENLTEERYCTDLQHLGALNYVTQCSPSEGQRLFGVTGKVNF